jgi:hypothetical protein
MTITTPENKRFDIPETTYECYLIDDGTLDTVIEIDGIEHRFNGQFASYCRDKEGAMTETGFKELCELAIDECEEHWN